MLGRMIRSFRAETGAAIAPLYALALFALVAVAGIGFDYARLAAMDSELQNAADQAALAAATQIDGNDGAIARAIAAAQGGLVTNDTLFANETGSSRAITVPTIMFYATKSDAENDVNGFNDPNDTALDALAAFVRVAVATRTANFALTPIFSRTGSAISAQAVAGIGSALCRTPPVMICNPAEPTNNTDPSVDFNVNAYRGVGLLLVGGGGSSWAPGNFGYLDTSDVEGAPGVRQALGWSTPPGECLAQRGVNTVDTEPGLSADVTGSLNTRFDIYDNNACPAGGGCPAAINSRKDLIRAASASGPNACKLHDNKGWHEVAASGQYRPTSATAPLPTTTTPTAMGHPRDMCHAVLSSVTGACTGPFGNGLWDRDAYFRSHYVRSDGTRWSSTDWPTNTGLGTSATRYEVYLWENEHQGTTVDGVLVLGPKGSPLVNHGTPICSPSEGYGAGTVPGIGTADRRRVSMAVVNCVAEGVAGSSPGVPVRRWADVFLVQPSVKRDENRTLASQIYVEIIGETSVGSAGEVAGSVIRRDVPFLIR